MAARRPKPEFPEYVRHAPDAPRVVQAAQIAFVVMQKARQKWWSHTVADPDATRLVILTDEQQALLEEFRGILPYLSRGGGGNVIRTVIGCGTCGRYTFVAGSGAAPKACPFTLGCEGSPVRAKSMNEPDPDRPRKAKADAAPAPEAPAPQLPAPASASTEDDPPAPAAKAADDDRPMVFSTTPPPEPRVEEIVVHGLPLTDASAFTDDDFLRLEML